MMKIEEFESKLTEFSVRVADLQYSIDHNNVDWKTTPIGNDEKEVLLDTYRSALVADHLLGELLAVIHGDGGHYQEEHGSEKAEQDAEAIVVSLRDKIDELKYSAIVWTPVSQRLPEVERWVSDPVLVLYEKDYGCAVCSYVPEDWKPDEWTYKKGWYRSQSGTPQTLEVTHRMPLPKPPEEVKNG
jgi:hypothetical protein